VTGEGVTSVLLGHHVEDGCERISCLWRPTCPAGRSSGKLAFYRTDLFTTVISELIHEQKPEIFLVEPRFRPKNCAQNSKRLGVGLSADCVSLDWNEQNEELFASSPAFEATSWRGSGGIQPPLYGHRKEGDFAERPHDQSASGEVVRLGKRDRSGFSKIHVILIRSGSAPDSQAGRMPGSLWRGGAGPKNAEGFNSIRELAPAPGRRGGGARRLWTAHWSAHEQLYRADRRLYHPELLITCGTSGAIQYTAGISRAETIVARQPAIRRHPFFKMADFGVGSGTRFSFLPPLLRR